MVSGGGLEETGRARRGVTTWLWKQASFLGLLAATLFVSAGRLDWAMGWVQLGLYIAAVAAQAIILIPRSPELIAERSGYQRGTKRWDLIIASLGVAVCPIATWIVAGLGVRFGWPASFSLASQLGAAVVWVLGYALTIWAMASNPFFSATVRIQTEREQRVVTGGPYRYARHPGYLGAIAFQLVTAIMLGSVWGLVPSVLSAALYVLRTAWEDRTLRQELVGYASYTEQVGYRLLPGVW